MSHEEHEALKAGIEVAVDRAIAAIRAALNYAAKPKLRAKIGVGVIAAASCYAAASMSPEALFASVSSSLVVVQVRSGGKVIGLGSGVVVEPHEIVTNCHVVADGSQLTVRHQGKGYSAQLLATDIDRDLCLLTVQGLAAPPVRLAPANSVRPGARVYAIGAPRGLELTISEGLASGLRELDGSVMIQSSAPISPGSSGGGLFDSDGHLIGITTMFLKESQNIGFALPAEWVGQVKARAGMDVLSAAVKATWAASLASPSPELDAETRAWIDAMAPRTSAYFADVQSSRQFLALVQYEAKRAGLDPHLVLAIIDIESHFRKYYVAKSGARGYMAVSPIWIERLGDRGDNLHTERTNLRYGCVIFRHYLDINHGDVRRALLAYDNQANNRPATFPDDKRQFVKQVLSAYRERWALSPNPS
jgi:hypothetical protein